MSTVVAEQGWIEAEGEADDILRDKSLPVGERFEKARASIVDEIDAIRSDISTQDGEVTPRQAERLAALSEQLGEYEARGETFASGYDVSRMLREVSSEEEWFVALREARSERHSSRVIEALIDVAFESGDYGRKINAVRFLSESKTADAARALVLRCLEDSDAKVQRDVWLVLSSFPKEIIRNISKMPEMEHLVGLSKVYGAIQESVSEQEEQRASTLMGRVENFIHLATGLYIYFTKNSIPVASETDVRERLPKTAYSEIQTAIQYMVEAGALDQDVGYDVRSRRMKSGWRCKLSMNFLSGLLRSLHEVRRDLGE